MAETIKPERLQAIHAKLLSVGQECVRAINQRCPFIVIVGHLPNKGWPRGKCIGSDSKGRFYSYDAIKVLAKIVALGVMTVDTQVRNGGN
jgi:hypothetical protein